MINLKAGRIALSALLLLLSVLAKYGPTVTHYVLQHEYNSQLRKDREKVISDRHDALFNDPAAPTAGNPNGDHHIAVFLDCNDPQRRAVDRTIQQALKRDPELKVYYIPYSSTRPGSKFAARAVLAASKQGKFEAFHHGLMATGLRLSGSDILDIARDEGLDVERLKRDMKDPGIVNTVKHHSALAKKLSIHGGPAVVVGKRVVSGAANIHYLDRYLANEREKDRRPTGSPTSAF
ncbi:DsbA family protein [Mesorhizobium sp. B283B1A]|uniref:DsbA family protein n=1 Tax=Mesorhizobium TaxID=68287 RepID=UPI001CD07B18|nr:MULTISPECIES: DsbA family protein [Mesorhizobium]MCA0048250.1 DsbA family protein [Mesorhizobium sp. B283B1A]UQS64539.1 DsbA family protein [Mesorhizobium opportunistum]